MRMPLPRRVWQPALIGLLAVVVVGGCRPGAPAHDVLTWQGSTMGTRYTVKITSVPDGLDPRALARRIEALLDEVNARMSTYRDDSELSSFNRARTTHWVPVSSELADVVAAAQAVSRASGGALDVTVGPLVDLWGFGSSAMGPGVPGAPDIRAAQERVGYTLLEVQAAPPALRKALPRVYVDLSAIAKGYGVDRVAAYLESVGIANYLVEIGGEVRGEGRHPRGTPWRIAIERPSSGERAVHQIIELDGVSVATSGDYRNYREQDGQRLSHVIDPKSGRPVTHGLASVTVLDPSAMRADAWATALMVLGPDAGYDLAIERDLPALFIIKGPQGFIDRATPPFGRFVAALERHDD